MPTQKINQAKTTAWTGTMKVECSGTIMGCSIELFNMIHGGAAQREIALQIMKENHERLKEKGL